MEASGFIPLSNPSRGRQNDVEMADAEEAQVAQHLLRVPMAAQPLTNFQTSQVALSPSGPLTISKPLPHLPPPFLHKPPMHPAFTLNDVPFTFPGPTQELHSNTQASGTQSLTLVPRNDTRRQQSRSRSRSPGVSRPSSPRPVELHGEVEPHIDNGTSKIRLVGIEDPQKDALIASLSGQLIKSNSLLQTFESELRAVKADTAALQSQSQKAEDRAKKAEQDLADQKQKSDERLRELEKTLRDDASQKVILAEKRAQSLLLDLKGIRRPTISTDVQQSNMQSGDAMVLDQPGNEAGKQRENFAPNIPPPRLQPPTPPRFPRTASPPEHPHAKERSRPGPSTAAFTSSPPNSTQSLPKPLNTKRPKSRGDAVHPRNDAYTASDDESTGSSAEDEDKEDTYPQQRQTNISGRDTDELLRLLLSTIGVNTTTLGPSRRRGHPELKNPVKRRANDEGKTKLMACHDKNWLRQHLNHLIGIKRTRDILNFRDEIFATNTELQRCIAIWENDQTGDGPKIEPMKIDWQNLEGPWNMQLCELFVQYCVTKGLGDGKPGRDVLEFVADYFWERLRRMRTIIRKNKPRMEEGLESHKARVNGRHLEALVTARRNTRRNQTYKDRIDICLDNLPRTAEEITTDEQRVWKVRHDVVQALGPEGMSSDESDPGSDSKTFFVKKLPWRNRRLVEAMKSIDMFRNTTNAYGNTRPGNSPRTRVRRETPRMSARKKAPTGKPVDAYDLDWYENLKYQKRVALRAKAPMNY